MAESSSRQHFDNARAAAEEDLDLSQPDLSPDSRRRMVCLEAVWELEELARTFPENLDNGPVELRMAARSFASRVAQLSGALLGGLSDGLVSTKQLARIVLLKDD